MNSTLTRKVRARFDVINRYNVTIKSLKNKIKQASGIDELTMLASKIIELEQGILVEKTAGYKELEREKLQIEEKVDKAKRDLQRLESELEHLDNKLDYKVNGYRRVLESRLDNLNKDYNMVLETMTDVKL
jgi:predicted nuclease with TOPRIM domain